MRFLMIGGFLGAGKTTAIGRLAKHYTDQGLKIGIVTNDQAFGLVDTKSLQSQGFHVGEVPGACFCCKFDDLISTIDQLDSDVAPDIVITEPVGSCTDLAATVIEPLKQWHEGRFEIAPLAVLLKPEHGIKILRKEPRSGFSPKAAYIFLKQMEEAEIIVINKVDKLTPETLKQLHEMVQAQFPNKQIVLASSTQGDGFSELINLLDQPSSNRSSFMEVDYDVYAEGEAELGWLNAEADLQATKSSATFSLDESAKQLLIEIKEQLLQCDAEPAHLKVLCQTKSNSAIANLVGSDVDVDLSLASGAHVSHASIVINARATIDPAHLETIVRQAVSSIATHLKANHEVTRLQQFRPGRPVPTHRLH